MRNSIETDLHGRALGFCPPYQVDPARIQEFPNPASRQATTLLSHRPFAPRFSSSLTGEPAIHLDSVSMGPSRGYFPGPTANTAMVVLAAGRARLEGLVLVVALLVAILEFGLPSVGGERENPPNPAESVKRRFPPPPPPPNQPTTHNNRGGRTYHVVHVFRSEPHAQSFG